MKQVVNNNLFPCDRVSYDKYGNGRFIDIHCHCLANIDDGPSTMSESLALCKALVNDGICAAIATPHQLGQFNCNTTAKIRKEVYALNRELKNNNISLIVTAGAEVRVDERACHLLEIDNILTLADNQKYLLLEFPYQTFVDIEPLLIELESMHIQAIISHPERHLFFTNNPSVLFKWQKYSVHFQITTGSLLGHFGDTACEAAWHFLSTGLASIVATDSHNNSFRKPHMKTAFQCIKATLGESIARLVCIDNPLSVLNGDDIGAVLLLDNDWQLK